MDAPCWTRRGALAAIPALALAGCGGTAARGAASGGWERLNAAAPFPAAYGYPVHVAADGRFIALHPRGTWESRDGANWTRSSLPPSRTNHAYLPLVQHRGEAWSFGEVRGDYTGFVLDPVVRRTVGYRRWETIGRATSLPRLVFPAVASFGGALWLFGGYDGARERNAIWRSVDGLAWRRMVEHAPWSPRSRARWAVFRDRLWLVGSGTVDGPIESEVCSSADGLAWRHETARVADPQPFGFTACVFDDRFWLVGANRGGGFASEMLVSDDGRDWRPVAAPWSPRGYPAVWTDGARMYLTGGKYSTPDAVTGEPRFIYANDVWAMAPSAPA